MACLGTSSASWPAVIPGRLQMRETVEVEHVVIIERAQGY